MYYEDSQPLIIIPKDVWVQPDWTSLGCPTGMPRRLHACLMNIYRIVDEGRGREKIVDWTDPKLEYLTDVDENHFFTELKKLIQRLVRDDNGVYVYSGMPLEKDLPQSQSAFGASPEVGVEFKSCHKPNPPTEVLYAASVADEMQNLTGFESWTGLNWPYTIGWFPQNDDIGRVVRQRYENWPDAECSPLLPHGPSPSQSSVEIVGQGWDMNFLGLFLPDDYPVMNAIQLRELFDDEAIIASVDKDNFRDWLEWHFNLDDLQPVDRPLPWMCVYK